MPLNSITDEKVSQSQRGRLNILRVIATADLSSGGPVEGLRRSSDVMKANGHHTEVVSLDPPGSNVGEQFSMPVHCLGSSSRIRQPYPSQMVDWIAKSGSRFDVIVIHGLWNWASIAGYRGAARANIPYVIFAHGMLDPWFKDAYPVKHWKKQLFWSAFQGPAMHNAYRVLFTTEEEMLRAQGVFWGFPFKSQTVAYGAPDIPTGSSQQEASFRSMLPSLKNSPYLLYLSRIHEKKGCDMLIDAFAAEAKRHPDLQLVIAGPDQQGLVKELRAQAEKLGISKKVHWPGMLEGEAKYGAFRGADAFVLPSHQENFGIVVAEALASGLPVLTTDKVNTWREVVASNAGIVEPDTVAGVRSLLRKWLDMSEDDVKKLRENARKCYDKHFTISEAGRDLELVLAKAASNRLGHF